MEDRERYTEEEIDLYELWEILVKRKLLILGIFFAVVFIAIIYSLSLPKVYEVKASIVPRKIFSLNNQLSVSPKELAKLFEEKYYLVQVFPVGKIPKLKVQTKKEVNIIDITYNTDKPTKGKRDIAKLLSIINEAKVMVRNTERALLRLKNDVEIENKALKENSSLYKQKYEIVRKKLEDLKKTKKQTEKRLSFFMQQINKVNLNPLRVFSYSVSIKILESKSNFLSDKYSYYLEEKTNIELQLIEIQKEIEKNNHILSLVQKNLKDLKLFDIVISPYYITRPVGPKKKLIVGVAGVGALFFAIFFAFFLEFLERGKRHHLHEP